MGFLLWAELPLFGLEPIIMRFLGVGSVLIGIGLLFLLLKGLYWSFKGAALQRALESHHSLDINALKKGMKEAIDTLKITQLGVTYRGKAAFYALPWFMVMGPSAAGKGTLLRRSGLHFPFSTREELDLKGFGGTRHCDAWFSDKAIFWDTAGRYTTETSDHNEWMAFLQIIRQYRSKCPLNGVIVTLPMADILTADLDTLKNHIIIIRERLSEIHQQLKFVPPIFLVLTKFDYLKGFQSFFSRLSDKERDEVFGVQFLEEQHAESFPLVVKGKLEALYAQLSQLRAHYLTQETQLNQKVSLLDFPEQFQSSIGALTLFIRQLLKKSPYHETPYFQGVYFTSAIQESAVCIEHQSDKKRFAETTFSLNRPQSSQAYFIKHFFQNILLAEKHKSYCQAHTHQQEKWKKRAVHTGMGALLVASSGIMIQSYRHNISLLTQSVALLDKMSLHMQGQIKGYTPEKVATQIRIYEHLVQLKQESQHFSAKTGLGFYKADKTLPPLSDVLQSTLSETFLHPLKEKFEQKLKDKQALWPTWTADIQKKERPDYYKTLSLYLMLSAPEGSDFQSNIDALTQEWLNWLHQQGTPVRFKPDSLKALVGYYLESIQQTPQSWKLSFNVPLIQQARQVLGTTTTPQEAYALFMAEESQPDTVATLFTKAGAPTLRVHYQRWLKQMSQGDWVLGQYGGANPARSAALHQTFKQQFTHDYIHHWFGVLKQPPIMDVRTLSDTLSLLRTATQDDGPLASLLKTVFDNVFWEKDMPFLNVEQVHQAFEPLRTFWKEKSLTPAWTQYEGSLIRLKQTIELLSTDTEPLTLVRQAEKVFVQGNTEFQASVAAAQAVAHTVSDARTQEAVLALLKSPIQDTWRALLQQCREGLDSTWHNKVIMPFQKHLAHKYPFDKKGEDATLEDFTDFFQPDEGVLFSFVNTYLAPFLEGKDGKLKTWQGIALPVSDEFLKSLQDSTQLSNAFFQKSKKTMGFFYALYPIGDARLSEMSFESNQTIYRYRHEPQEWHGFEWPSTHAQSIAKVSATAAKGHSASFKTEGPWALFRLFDVASRKSESTVWTLKNPSGEIFSIQFKTRMPAVEPVAHFTLPEHLS
jgi:type VI secretion system protein ImpL